MTKMPKRTVPGAVDKINQINLACGLVHSRKLAALCTSALLLLIGTSGAGIHKVEYDLFKNSYVRGKEPPKCIVSGDVINLDICNVNQIKYKIVVGSQTYTYKFDMQDSLSKRMPVPIVPPTSEAAVVSGSTEMDASVKAAQPPDSTRDFNASYSRLAAICNYNLRFLIQNRAFERDSAKNQAEIGLKNAYGVKKLTYYDFIQKADNSYNAVRNVLSTLRRDSLAAIAKPDPAARAVANDKLANAEKTWVKFDSTLGGVGTLNAKVSSDWDFYQAIVNSETVIGTTITPGNQSDGLDCRVSVINKTDPSDSSSFGFSVKVRKPFQGFFSVGVFMSSIHDSAYGSKDTTIEQHTMINGQDSVQQVNSKKLVDQTGSPVSYGFCVLYHWMYYPVEWFGFGSNFGVTLDVPEVNRTELLTGASIAFGEMSRLVLSGGISLSKVSRLADGLVLDRPYQSDLSTVPTVLKNQWGWFGCITYAFGQEVINK
jgi:hypothetical protein